MPQVCGDFSAMWNLQVTQPGSYNTGFNKNIPPKAAVKGRTGKFGLAALRDDDYCTSVFC